MCWRDPAAHCINLVTEFFTSGNLRDYRQKHHKQIELKAIKKWARQVSFQICLTVCQSDMLPDQEQKLPRSGRTSCPSTSARQSDSLTCCLMRNGSCQEVGVPGILSNWSVSLTCRPMRSRSCTSLWMDTSIPHRCCELDSGCGIVNHCNFVDLSVRYGGSISHIMHFSFGCHE